MSDSKKHNTAKSTQDNHFTNLILTIKDTVLFPVHPEGWPFILIFALVSAVSLLFSETLFVLTLILTGWCVYFFRNPDRVTPVREGLIISPAYGKICDISENVAPPEELDEIADKSETYTRVSIFLSVFDVHVNRIPIDGKIIQKVYRPGKFVNAALDKASSDNEMAGLAIRTNIGGKEVDIAVCQIAGWVARRIVTNVEDGQDVKAGQELGIIRFGSRADVYLPKGVAPMVMVGQRTIEGETVLADMKGKEKPREGQVR